MTLPHVLRTLALAIAVFGLVDPAITSERAVKPVVSVISSSAGDPAIATLRDDVSARLAARYAVIPSRSADAAATVVVGTTLPANARDVPAPAFAVIPATTRPTVTVGRLDVPATAPLGSPASINVTARAHGAEGKRLLLTLEADGVVADRLERPIGRADERIDAVLHLAGAKAGLAAVRVRATVPETDALATADAGLEFVDLPWQVLFFERRPSWASTFVRRALERDARFAVRSRTVTSTGLATERGQPPGSLADLNSLEAYAVVVAGAPDALTAADVVGLEAFARKRGGTVVLLVEEALTGAAASLADVSRWDGVTPLEPQPIVLARGGDPLRSSEFVVPGRVPAGASILASATLGGASRPIIFERALGAGRVIVSGAADAWRYRGVPESSAFDRFWQQTIGLGAESAPSAVAISLDDRVLSPGAATTVRVTLRGPALGEVSASVVSTIGVEIADASGRVTPVRVWPDGAAGRFAGTLTAPEASGRYRVMATSAPDRGVALLAVIPDARRAADDENLLRVWVASRGGVTTPSTDLPALDRALSTTLHPEHRRERWWPMRAGWWIAPFAALLGGEWWLRRRRDLR